jgi:hypothetical protein
MSTSQNQHSLPAIPSLLEDMQAEFGQCWLDPAHENRIRDEQIKAIEIALEHAAQSLPAPLRIKFMAAGLEKMNMKFNRDYRGISETQFHAAIALISAHITEFRDKFDLSDISSNGEQRRWRAFFQMVTGFSGKARNV